ncbi:MAG: chromosomal replication initiator protein DnaA [Victivallaceae bacterium]|nr:chromosomal replication initiator protein DnaA [Victivallaceae bacterium]
MYHGDSGVRQLWELACSKLNSFLNPVTYEQIAHNIIPLRLEDKNIHLGISDSFFGDWLNDNFGTDISNALKDINGVSYSFVFEEGHRPEEFENAEPDTGAAEAHVEAVIKPLIPRGCNAQHTFDNFAVGEENRYSYTAARTAAESPGLYNPLYIYGGTGLGKTHLLQAVAHHVLSHNPKSVVKYVTCEEFLNRYVGSIKNQKMGEFRDSFRGVDVFLVDDVHFLSTKTQLQEEFFNTFNTLHNYNKQIIMTSDKQPAEIHGLEERLVSRFESGLTTEIFPPGFETRLAILQLVQEKHLIKIDEAVLRFVAARISSSVRRLIGSLTRLVAYASVSNCQITERLAEDLLRPLFEEEQSSKNITIDAIQKAVSDHFELSRNDILSSQRPKNMVEPRMLAMYLCRELTNHSFPEIGQAFHKNHATVMNAVKKIPGLCLKDEKLRRSAEIIKRRLRSN